MILNKMSESAEVAKQYSDDEALKVRKNLHHKYSKNKQGFNTWLFNHYDFKSDYKVLEIGSGNGDLWANTIDNLSDVIDLTLSDSSQGMVNILSENYKSTKVVKIDIQDIPFKDGSYDIVIANAMLYHVPDLHKAVSEVSRVLKKNGVFYASTFGENGLNEFIINALFELNMVDEKSLNHTFTLQNGADELLNYFSTVHKKVYDDGLKIDDVNDLVEYIFTMTMMYGLKTLDKKMLLEYFEKKKDKDGFLRIPKEYGTFIAVK